MKIYGIGIYTLHKQKINQAPDGFTLHFSDPLKSLVEKSLTLLEEIPDATYNFQNTVDNEHHYFQVNREHDIILAICSRQALERRELYYLFEQILFVYLEKAPKKVSLQAIIDNPLEFLKDPRVSLVQDQANEVKQRLLETLPKVLQRGEMLEELIEKTDQLANLSVTFKREAEKTNKCCNIF